MEPSIPSSIVTPTVRVQVHASSYYMAGRELLLYIPSRSAKDVRDTLQGILKTEIFVLLYNDSIIGPEVYITDNSPLYVYVPHFKYNNRTQHAVCICNKKSLPISDADKYLIYYMLNKKSTVLDLLILTTEYKEKSYFLGKNSLIDPFLYRCLNTYKIDSVFMPHFTATGFHLQTKRSNNVKVPIYLKFKSTLPNSKVIPGDTLLVVIKLSENMAKFMSLIRVCSHRHLANNEISVNIENLRFQLYFKDERILSTSERKLHEFPNLDEFSLYVGCKESSTTSTKSTCSTTYTSTLRNLSIPSASARGKSKKQDEVKRSVPLSPPISSSVENIPLPTFSANFPIVPIPDTSISDETRMLTPSFARIAQEVKRNSFRTIEVRGAQGMSILDGATRCVFVRNSDTVEYLLTVYCHRIRWEMDTLPKYLILLDSKGRHIWSKSLVADLESLVDVIGSN